MLKATLVVIFIGRGWDTELGYTVYEPQHRSGLASFHVGMRDSRIARSWGERSLVVSPGCAHSHRRAS
ncbi:hypothetical protein HMPREF9607_02850 [Cutibacterium modestum HL044PA1]|uniref:Uncharacterized protein n=1 Tax=Cutibacterium modestum HL044PA1 TaxID=765109 RepID=A0ABP2K2R0_9ACTN|nr:hypothetical protein HMPREF9607_02850 [Cutibacterium modestum HL044PA1]